MSRRRPLCSCGVPLDPGQSVCVKCDRPTALGRSGWTQVDVAHHGQTGPVAERQADAALAQAQGLLAAGLVIFHGRGDRLRLAVRNRACRWLMEGRIAKFEDEPGNPGALRVWLRPPV